MAACTGAGACDNRALLCQAGSRSMRETPAACAPASATEFALFFVNDDLVRPAYDSGGRGTTRAGHASRGASTPCSRVRVGKDVCEDVVALAEPPYRDPTQGRWHARVRFSIAPELRCPCWRPIEDKTSVVVPKPWARGSNQRRDERHPAKWITEPSPERLPVTVTPVGAVIDGTSSDSNDSNDSR